MPPRIPSFTGRESALDRLDAILTGGRTAAVTQIGRAAVQGMGGVGKTSLAVEYANRYRDLYAGVWWCPAETRIGLLTSLAALAKDLAAAPADEPDIEKAAKAGLRRLAEQRATFLLVYDNVTSPDDIADLLPASGARLLLTSRFADWSGWAEEVPLDVLPPAEASSFLENRATRRDPEGAAALAEALGRLPLALDHAAAYCKRTQMSFSAYAAKAAQLIATVPRGTSYPRSVAATFDLAIAEAVRECPSAEILMAYLAACAPERIPLALVEGALADEADRAAALLALADVSLLRHDPFEDGTPALTVHRLVQAAARARAAVPASERVVARLTEIYPADGYDNPASWPLCAQLTPHLLVRCEPDPAHGPGTADQAALLNRAAQYFHGIGAYTRARPLFERALAISENALGPDHPNTATSLNDLAVLLHDLGDLAAARPLHERALATREKALSPDHPDIATNLSNLAALLQAQGDLAAARPLQERALAIREKALGPDHPDIATNLNNLANLLFDQGDLAAARPLHERALAIREKALGPEHPDTATSVNNLANLLNTHGDLAAARPLHERALAIREKVLGPEHPATASGLNNLAELLLAQGDLAAARPLHERALAIREKALGPDHPDIATNLNNLANLLLDQGDLAAARPLCARALAIGENVLGSEHPLTGRLRSNYARLLLAAGDPAAALAASEAALATHEKSLGPNHPWTADSARITADALAALGRTAEAEALRARHAPGGTP